MKKRGKCPNGGTRDSSGDCRNYAKEGRYEARPEQVRNRVARNQARREMGLKVGDPREVDHKTPLNKGGSHGRENLRITSRSFNRARAAKAR